MQVSVEKNEIDMFQKLSAHLFGCRTAMVFGISLIFSFLGGDSGLMGQEEGDSGAKELPDAALVSLKKIQDDYREHLAKRERVFESYRAVEETLKETEGDFQRITNESIRNQMLAMQSQVQSQQLGVVLRGLSVRNLQNQSTRSRPVTRDPITQMQKQLVREKTNADLNTSIKMEELRQLDSAGQAIVRRRLMCFQSGMELQQEWAVLQQEWLKFFMLYWPHTDPEQRFTKREIEERLAIFDKSERDDYAALIARALLMERVGKASEGLKLVDQVLAADTAFETTACYVKSLLLCSLDRNKDAKVFYQRGMKDKVRSPYDVWLRGRIATLQKQLALAESEWKSLASIPEFEVSSRRALALLHYTRISKSPVEGRKSFKEAQEAFDLEPAHDWYSHFVLGLAAYGAGDGVVAKEHIDQAFNKSSDENRLLCEKVQEAIENDRPFVWEFRRDKDLGK